MMRIALMAFAALALAACGEPHQSIMPPRVTSDHVVTGRVVDVQVFDTRRGTYSLTVSDPRGGQVYLHIVSDTDMGNIDPHSLTDQFVTASYTNVIWPSVQSILFEDGSQSVDGDLPDRQYVHGIVNDVRKTPNETGSADVTFTDMSGNVTDFQHYYSKKLVAAKGRPVTVFFDTLDENRIRTLRLASS